MGVKEEFDLIGDQISILLLKIETYRKQFNRQGKPLPIQLMRLRRALLAAAGHWKKVTKISGDLDSIMDLGVAEFEDEKDVVGEKEQELKNIIEKQEEEDLRGWERRLGRRR